MNEDENNLPPTLKPAVEKQQIKIRFKRFLYLAFGLCGLLVLLIAYGVGSFDSDKTKIDDWLKFHHLALLPATATNLRYYQWNGLFTGETYIKFQLPGNELTLFLSNSATGLSQGKADTFTASHQHLPYSTNNSQMDVHHSYYGKSRMFPEWYNPTITNNGRGYILWRGPNSEVYIDEDSSTVYLHSVKG